MKVTLEILASDILETSYTDARDCAITRALARAGFPNYRECGTEIVDREVDGENYKYDIKLLKAKSKRYQKLSNRVKSMYAFTGQYFGPDMVKTKPADFKVVLNLKD